LLGSSGDSGNFTRANIFPQSVRPFRNVDAFDSTEGILTPYTASGQSK